MTRISSLLLRTSTSALCFLVSAFVSYGQTLQQSELPTATSTRTISPRFEHLSLEDGLSQSSVYTMHQDKHGFIWMGTQAGLNRYDGHEFKVFANEPFDSTTVNDGWILDLDEDEHGRIWIGTRNSESLDMFDPVTETFTHFKHSEDDSTTIPDGRVRSLMTTNDGVVWVGTDDGLASTSTENPGVFTRYYHLEDDSTSLSHNDVHVMFEDAAGILWFGTHNGLSRMDPAEPGKFKRYMMASEFPDIAESVGDSHELFAFFERPRDEGVLWIGADYGLIRFDTETGEFSRSLAVPDHGGDWRLNAITSITSDPMNPGYLWVGFPQNGLARFDVRTRGFILYQHDPSNPSSLAANNVQSVMTDRSGMVWVGLETDGVQRFNPSSVGFEHIRYTADKENALPGTNVWGIYQTRDGMLWVDTESPGEPVLTRINRATGEHLRFESEEGNKSMKPGNSTTQMLEDDQGYLWVAAGVLARMDQSTLKWEWFEPDENVATGMPSYRPRSLVADQLGNLWVGTWRGVVRTDLRNPGVFEQFLFEPDQDGFDPEMFVSYLIEDLAGFVWVATAEGLVRIEPESGDVVRFKHDPHNPASLSNDYLNMIVERSREPGILWIASSGGLNRFDTSTETARHFTVRDGLANNTLYGVLEDDEGRLWMSTNAGLSRFDPDTETFRNYGLEIGLQSLEFNQSSAFKAPSGELFFGGVNGLNAFFPNEVSENLNAPAVALVDLKVFNESIKNSDLVSLEAPLAETEQIVLDYTQQDLAFDYVALHFADPGKNEFAYMLEGYDEDWINVGDIRTATFTNLAPGDYTFRVKAANSDGIWNEEGASIRVVITPPFWATWWFRMFAFVTVGGFIYGGYAFRVRQIESHARELEGQVSSRTAELRTSNTQLEQSATIVEAINQETSFSRLLTKILEEARVIPGVEKATALVYLQDDDRFHVRASSGWDVAEMQGIRLTRREARDRYVRQADEVAEDIFVAKDVAGREGSDQMAEFGQVASFLVLRVEVDGETSGYLVFDNLTDPDAFAQRDVELLSRLREHIQSAFIKTRILEELQGTLSDLQSTQDRLIQSEKMASLGQLTAGIAHEIKNPLNFVNNFSEVTTEIASDLASEIAGLKDVLPAEKAKELESMLEGLTLNAQKIAEHGKRADGIVQNMLEHSQAGEGQRAPTDLNDLLDEYVTLAHHGFRAQAGDFEVKVERSFGDGVGRVDIVPQDMGRVFMNLISNAFDALKEYGSNGAEPVVTIATAKSDHEIEIRISDNGPGIPEKVKARIFEPFFTTKPTGSGTGLGLSMSYDIVTKGHGGSLEVESVEGLGATFVVKLPA
jgi:signal transduction histidine kinase/ligand-binding sensor domain-containing protein